MSYDEWLNNIELLKNTNINHELLDRLKGTELNDNIANILEPKLSALVKDKFKRSVEKVIRELPDMFGDVNYLDLTLIDFKKEIQFIEEIISLKQISQTEQENLLEELKREVDSVFEVIKKEANNSDQTGVYALTVENNKIKWSE